MSINLDAQQLAPGDRVRLFEVDCTAFDGPELYFHNHPIPHSAEELAAAAGDENKLPAKSLWWQGKEYKAWPTHIEGLEMTSDGSAPTPTLAVGNIDGTITALCLVYQNLAQATVRIHTTFAHYLDARNFPNGNHSADPTQERLEVWYIDSKANEDNESVTFNLSSPADLQGIMIPTRQIHSLCTWCARGQYRGASCVTPDRVISTLTAIRSMIRQRMSAPGCFPPAANRVLVKRPNCRLAAFRGRH